MASWSAEDPWGSYLTEVRTSSAQAAPFDLCARDFPHISLSTDARMRLVRAVQADLSAHGDPSVTILHQSPAGVSMNHTKVYGSGGDGRAMSVGPGGDACASPPQGVESSPAVEASAPHHQQLDEHSTLSLCGSISPAPRAQVPVPRAAFPAFLCAGRGIVSRIREKLIRALPPTLSARDSCAQGQPVPHKRIFDHLARFPAR